MKSHQRLSGGWLFVDSFAAKASKKRPGSMVEFIAEHHPEALFPPPGPSLPGPSFPGTTRAA